MKALVEKIFIVPDGQICTHKGTMQNNSDKISWKSNFHNWKDDKCSRGGDWKEFKAAPFILKPVTEWPFLCSDMRRDFGPLWFYRYVNASCGPAAEIVWQTKCLRGESLPANCSSVKQRTEKFINQSSHHTAPDFKITINLLN